ncbi:DUF485 domain-containing protein [Leucobacter weissii]|uniref:DUF485 domain-containing protein n=1 Tax=Leucobacter weissii TaxID=1983706 RepID=A0A939MKE2_9MICO|nr:DUF485 domain-containing protein [Leucobacter weissii]MBO1902598.1 DUF485 domain-containing protein [Leucobacter weissii]
MSNDARSPIDYEEFRARPEFQDLKRRYRRFVFPLAAAFMLWFLSYVVLGAFFPQVMAAPVPGFVNLGILLGLLQFVTTFGITMWYVSFANRRLDPRTSALRAELEEQERSAADEGSDGR